LFSSIFEKTGCMKEENIWRKTYRKLLKFFIQGVLVLAPVTITGYLLYLLFDKVDSILRPYVNIPGLGFAILITFVILVGWISSNFLMGSMLGLFDHWLEKTPGIKFLYSSIKDFFEAFAGEKKKFDKAVLINAFSDNVWIIGFLTDNEMKKFEMGADHVAVYVPQAYNFAGQLFILPRNKVKKIQHITSGEAMKYAVTGGVVRFDEDEEKTELKPQEEPIK